MFLKLSEMKGPKSSLCIISALFISFHVVTHWKGRMSATGGTWPWEIIINIQGTPWPGFIDLLHSLCIPKPSWNYINLMDHGWPTEMLPFAYTFIGNGGNWELFVLALGTDRWIGYCARPPKCSRSFYPWLVSFLDCSFYILISKSRLVTLITIHQKAKAYSHGNLLLLSVYQDISK